MDKKTRFNVWYVVLAIWGVLLLQNLIVAQYRPKVIPYSDFLQALSENRVLEVAVTNDAISGKMHENKAVHKEGNQTSDEDVINFTTVRVGHDLSENLSRHKVVFRGEVENTFFQDILSWVVPMFLFFAIWVWLMKRMNPNADMLKIGKNKAKIIAEKDLDTRFSDVAGCDEAKEELQEIIDFLKHPSYFEDLGGRMPKGILLVGPPGTGKTLLARAVAGESGVPFFSMSGSDFVEMFVGMGAARVRDLFAQAREKAPCIIFIDELDAIGKARGQAAIGGHDEREQTLNQLLVEMDGFDPRVGVVIMAATNRPEILDPALLRAGRFDRHVLVDKPDYLGREQILKVHARNIKLGEDVDLSLIARKTPGFSGADLANVLNESALLAARKKKKEVNMSELDEAVDRIIGGLEKKNRVINAREKRIVAWHETGHALVAALTSGSDPVEKISIIPRGLAALGYTQQRPTEDRYLMSRSELIGKIDVLLGGRVAEKLTFGDVTTGAHNDLQRATDTARAMIAEYGMGETLGLATFPKQNRPAFLSNEAYQGSSREYSEETAAKLDHELKQLLDEREAHVESLLQTNKQALDSVAEHLLENEVLASKEFLDLLKENGVTPVNGEEENA